MDLVFTICISDLRLWSIFHSPFTIHHSMKLLLIGDVVGKPGRSALVDRLQDLKEQHAIDFTVMNAENVAGGFSITPAIADFLFSSGIDVMTSGNHIFDKHEVIEYIQKQPRLLRPANYPP